VRPIFHPALVNGPFGDPALYVDSLFERRALLFDLGDLAPLASRKILRVTHAFVTHAHMDHFVGFDRVLRTCLHQDKTLQLFGPPPFIDQVEHKLAAYTWNLVRGYPNELVVGVTEVHPDGRGRQAAFRSRAAFRREAVETVSLTDGILLDEDTLRVRAAVLDHRIPCLAFALEEKAHVNVWKARLDEMNLPSGPWLSELKRAVLEGAPDERPFRVWWREGATVIEKQVPLGHLKERLLSMTPGQKIGYVVDAVYHEENARRIVDLVRGADLLFIETPFLQEDLEVAAQKAHLTAHQAGLLAREARVKRLHPFHFSPRYLDREERLRQEARAALAS
jgi:ribonuclease Z